MKPVVLVGHRHSCPLHGNGTVTTGATDTLIDGRRIARVGDHTSCGAVIATGSADFLIDGQAVAHQGDSTSHGGTLEEGDSNWMIE